MVRAHLHEHVANKAVSIIIYHEACVCRRHEPYNQVSFTTERDTLSTKRKEWNEKVVCSVPVRVAMVPRSMRLLTLRAFRQVFHIKERDVKMVDPNV